MSASPASRLFKGSPRLMVAAVLCLAGHPVLAGSTSAGTSSSLGARELGVIVNDRDPLSIQIGNYYLLKRNIPVMNVIHVRIDPARATLGAKEFATLKAEIDRQAPAAVQAYALTWVRPYRVECMSITTAVAMGFDDEYCGEGCSTSRVSTYFNSNSRAPFADLHLRPTMSIAALDFQRAQALIDRGVASDGSAPRGTAYLVETQDDARNVRARLYGDARMLVGNAANVEIIAAARMRDRRDVMFYFIGATDVPELGTLQFLPGAVADHLTSFGGDLTGAKQMSSLRWLEAGATGSYGTVTEPCNITSKFPNPGLMMRRYLAGETLIEAYWKSVAMPGQGIFIGEPLATPYLPSRKSGPSVARPGGVAVRKAFHDLVLAKAGGKDRCAGGCPTVGSREE